MPRKKKQPYGLAAHRAARNYETAVKPYHQVLEKLKLPKREPPGSEANYLRVFIVAAAMRAAKYALKEEQLAGEDRAARAAARAKPRLTPAAVRRVVREAPKL